LIIQISKPDGLGVSSAAILRFVFQVMEAREVMQIDGFVASLAHDPRATLAVSVQLITNRMQRTAQVTSAVQTPEEVILHQVKGTILAGITAPLCHPRFTHTLSVLGAADGETSDRSRGVARALLTTVGVVGLQVPVERLAHVADAAADTWFADAQRAFRSVAAATEALNHSGRIAVAFCSH
jgi:hypothetical protein